MKAKHFALRLNKEHLTEDETTLNNFLQTVEVSKTDAQVVMHDKASYWSVVVWYEEVPQEESNAESKPAFDPNTLSKEEKVRYEALRKWRNELAEEKNRPPFIIAQNSELAEIAQRNISTPYELMDIRGFGEYKTNKYANAIIDVLDALR